MKKKAALLLLVPLLSLLVVPVATVSAHYPNSSLYVYCRDSNVNYPTSVVLTIHGVQVSVNCTPDSSWSEYTCLYLAQPTSYKVVAIATASVFKMTGTFGPHMGAIVGSRTGGFGDTFVLWILYPFCEGPP
jgi:hypothetical protein